MVRGAIKVAIGWDVVKGHGCRRGILVFLHRMHGDVSVEISTRCSLAIAATSAETYVASSRKVEIKENETERNQVAHRNVPPEKSNNTPVHHAIVSSSPPPPPSVLTTTQVPNAPTGAARLNTTRCALAPLFPSPCFNSTDVSPNAAGALWTITATKIIREREVVDLDEEEAPKAIPSAAAWIHRPRVVERARCGGGDGGVEDRSERE